MKSKIHKILGVVLTLVLLGSLTAGMAVPAAAAPEAWTRLPTPAPGILGSYLMGPAAGVTNGPGPMEKAIDDTIYAYWDIGEGALGSNLYKSGPTNAGLTWTRCSSPVDDLGAVAIVAIACSTEDAKRLYVTDGTDVYKSIDAGATFVRLVNPGIAPNQITCMTVGFNGDHFIYIGTTNAGGDTVLVLRDAFGYTWGPTGFAALDGGRNVRALACSPNFTTEAQPQVIAVSEIVVAGVTAVVGEAYVTYQYGGAAWTYDNNLEPPGAGTGVFFTGGITAADIAFPSDYNSAFPAMDLSVGVVAGVAGEGGVYRIVDGTDIHQLGLAPAPAPVNVTSLVVAGPSGACKILAAGTQRVIYHSEDNGVNWLFSQKSIVQATGTTAKYLVMDDDYFTNGKAWVAVNRAAGAPGVLDDASVAQTTDFGVSFTDLSLINTNVTQIFNMEVSPDYANDGTVFLATDAVGGVSKDSVWKGSGTAAPNGTYWTRVFTPVAPLPLLTANTAMVKCSPNYATDNAVFVADTASRQIYWSPNGGIWFIPQTSPVPNPFSGALIALNSTTLIAGSGTNACVSGNNGTTWTPIGTGSGGTLINSFAVSPDGSALLAGDDAGGVFRSTDGGYTWAPVLPGVATPGGGALNVAFDADYASNNTIYAADATSDDVYRAVLGTDTSWRRIDGVAAVTWPGASTAGAIFNASRFVPGIQATSDGALYVADAAAVAGGLAVGDAFTVIDPSGTDAGAVTVTGGAVTIANISGTPIAAGTYAAPATIAWASTLANDAFSVAAAAPGSAGTWTAFGGGFGATAGITSDVDGDAFVNLPSIFVPSASWSLPDAAGLAGAAVARAMLRSVNPTFPTTSPFGVYFEPMNTAFTPAAAPAGVWYTAGSNTLFTLESAAGGFSAVWMYTDNLTAAPNLASPTDGTDTGRTTTAMLTWEALPNCPQYEIWVAPNPLFSPYTPYFSNTTSVLAVNLVPGASYYWKVCSLASVHATTPGGRALSPWSEDWSFTTGLAAAEWNPFVPPENVAPTPGATGVSLSPTFQFNPADWATGYEFVLADNSAFTSPMVEETLDTTVYAYTGTLAYSTTYYWKVRAVSATSESVWATGTFTTMAKPVPPPEPTPPVVVEMPAPITPAWIWAIVIIGAILVIAVIVLIVTTRRVP